MDSSNKTPTPIVDLNIPAVEELIQMDEAAEIIKGNFSESHLQDSVHIEPVLSSMVEGVPEGDMQVESKGVDGGDSDKSNESMNIDEFVSTVVEPEVKGSEPSGEAVVEGLEPAAEKIAEDDTVDEEPEVEVQEPEVEVQEPAKEFDTDEDIPLSELIKKATLAKENPETAIVKEVNPILIESEEELESPESSSQRIGKRKKSVTSHRRVLPLRSAKKSKVSVIEEESEPEVPEPSPKPTPRKSVRSNLFSKKIKKTVLDEFLIDAKFLHDHHLEEVYECIEEQGWADVFGKDDPVDKEIVAEFYENLTKEEKGSFVYLHFQFRGLELTVSSKELAFELELKHEGFDTFTKKQWPEGISETEKEEMVKRVCNYYDPNVTDLSTNHMLPTSKILHRLLVSTILPRGSKPALSQIHDILVLDRLMRRQPINLPKLILHQMEYMSQFNQVGHARVVKKILQMHDLYEPTKETSVAKPLTLNNFHRWGIQYNEDQGWVRRSGLEESAKGEGSRTAEIKELLLKIQKDVSDLKEEVTEIKKRLDEQATDNWIFHDEFEGLKSLIKAEFAKLGSRTSP